jgi:nucleoside-diphosphate-sugar epimerase
VADTSPEVIFHLAGQPYAPFTTEHPDKAYRDNVVTTANMLEVARAAPGTQFILASSACYFGAAQSSPLREGDPTFVPEHFYTYTKRHAESLVTDYSEFFGVPSAICRFVNVYGPGDRHFGRIIPQLCKQLIELQPESLALRRSAGDSVFEFLYVDDVVSGLLAAAGRRSEAAETYQFGPGTCGRSDIAGLARRLSRIFDGKHRLISGKHLDSERTVTKYLETSKARQVLGWLSEWGLDEGLQDTLDWYSTHLGNIEPAQDGLA